MVSGETMMTERQEDDSLAVLTGDAHERLVPVEGGLSIAVKPLPIGKWPRMMALLRPAMTTALDEVDETEFMIAHLADLMLAVALATDLSAETVQAWQPDDFDAVWTAVWEVNKDFFMRMLGPMVRRRMALATTGPTSLAH